MTNLPSFDEMVEMAKDPKSFDTFRHQKIEECINSLPEEKQKKARAQQWRLDQDLKKIKNDQVRLSMLYSEMVNSLNKLNLLFNDSEEYRRLFNQSNKERDNVVSLENRNKNV